mgnify:CR=1 FL=1
MTKRIHKHPFAYHWIPLYACQSLQDLDAWIGRDLQSDPRTRAAWGSFHLRHPRWVTDAPQHLTDFQAFVNGWLFNTLKEEDWTHACQWPSRPHLNPLEWLLTGPNSLRYQMEDWITQTHTDHLWLPFEEAHRAVLRLMLHEQEHCDFLKPVHCHECKLLFVPERRNQTWCRGRCRNRFFQRTYRREERTARHKSLAPTS